MVSFFYFRALPGLEGSMSTLRSGPRSPRSPGPRAPSRARKFDVYAPLRSAQSEVPRTSCAVSRFFLIAIPVSDRTVGDIIYRGLYFSKMMNGKVTGDFPILFSILLLYVTCHFHLLLLLFHPIHHFHTFLIMSCFQPYDIPDGWLL